MNRLDAHTNSSSLWVFSDYVAEKLRHLICHTLKKIHIFDISNIVE